MNVSGKQNLDLVNKAINSYLESLFSRIQASLEVYFELKALLLLDIPSLRNASYS